MAAGAAPEIPVLAYLAVGLLAMLAWAVLRGLAGGYRHTFGWLLERLAAILSFHVGPFHVDLGGPVRALDNALLHTLTAGAAKSEHAMGYFFHGAAVLQEWASRELLHLASETFGWAQWLQHVHLPRWARWAAAAAVPPALIARLVRAAIRAELPRIEHVAHAAAHGATVVITQRVAVPHLGELQWIHRHWRSLTAAVATAGAGAVAGRFPWAHVFPRLGHLERETLSVRKRLRRLEKLLAASGLAVAMANVLGLPNWRCLTRGNVGRTARALCGIPAHLLSDLLALAVDFFVIADICQVVRLLSEAFAVVEGPLADFAGAAGAALCHGDYAAPPSLELHPFAVPPLQARSAPEAA